MCNKYYYCYTVRGHNQNSKGNSNLGLSESLPHQHTTSQRRHGSHVCRSQTKRKTRTSHNQLHKETQRSSGHRIIAEALGLYQKQRFKQTSKSPEQCHSHYSRRHLLFQQRYSLSHFKKPPFKWSVMIQNRQHSVSKVRELETKGTCFLVNLKTCPCYQRINQRKSRKVGWGSV